MEADAKYALERFRGMSREELLEEAALRVEEYVPLVRRMLEDEALARGISPAELEQRRQAAAPAAETAIDFPALITSGMEQGYLRDLSGALRREGIPAVVREIDTRAFHGSGHAVGRWGLFVPGPHAAEAARRLEALLPPAHPDAAHARGGCGDCGGACGSDQEEALEPGEWDENGDWWKTGAPGEEEQ